MAKQVVTRLTDDLDGSDATTTVHFAWKGTAYEIELSDANVLAFDAELERYIGAARVVTPARGRRTPTGVRPAANRTRTDAIRAWAKAAGLDIAERGRIAAAVVAAFDAAQVAPSSTKVASTKVAAKKVTAKKVTAKKGHGQEGHREEGHRQEGHRQEGHGQEGGTAGRMNSPVAFLVT